MGCHGNLEGRRCQCGTDRGICPFCSADRTSLVHCPLGTGCGTVAGHTFADGCEVRALRSTNRAVEVDAVLSAEGGAGTDGFCRICPFAGSKVSALRRADGAVQVYIALRTESLTDTFRGFHRCFSLAGGRKICALCRADGAVRIYRTLCTEGGTRALLLFYCPLADFAYKAAGHARNSRGITRSFHRECVCSPVFW